MKLIELLHEDSDKVFVPKVLKFPRYDGMYYYSTTSGQYPNYKKGGWSRNPYDAIVFTDPVNLRVTRQWLHQVTGGFKTATSVDLRPKTIKKLLIDEDFIKHEAHQYNAFVKQHFKDNSVLMNKWLRYANNVRNLD